VLNTFAWLGGTYFLVCMVTGFFMVNPPDGWKPEGWTPSTTQVATRATADYSLSDALKSWQWWILWFLLFLNTSAGISIISQESPLFQEVGHVSAIVAASMVGVVSIGNAFGRVFWAWVSDILTRRWTFTVMFLLQVVLFWILFGMASASALMVVSFVILMCYGGGFGTMPAFAADYYGLSNVGSIYGLMLTAWGCASAFGPLLIAHLRQVSGSYLSGLHIIAGIMLVSALLPVVLRRPKDLHS
jgi:MFS transporter, OFA family, oxalate/formate antiporter